MSAEQRPPIPLAGIVSIGIAAVAVPLLALAPPARGEMLLLPLVAAVPVARIARDHGALLVGTTRSDRLVVRGERSALLGPLLRAGILPLAARGVACGESR